MAAVALRGQGLTAYQDGLVHEKRRIQDDDEHSYGDGPCGCILSRRQITGKGARAGGRSTGKNGPHRYFGCDECLDCIYPKFRFADAEHPAAAFHGSGDHECKGPNNGANAKGWRGGARRECGWSAKEFRGCRADCCDVSEAQDSRRPVPTIEASHDSSAPTARREEAGQFGDPAFNRHRATFGQHDLCGQGEIVMVAMLDVSAALTNPFTSDSFSVLRRKQLVNTFGQTKIESERFDGVRGVVYPEGRSEEH